MATKGDIPPPTDYNQQAMGRYSEFTTYRQYQEGGLYWLEITTAEIFTETHCFDTAEERDRNLAECCRIHEADFVPPEWRES